MSAELVRRRRVEAPGFSPVNIGSLELGFSPGEGEPGLKPQYALLSLFTGLKPGASTLVRHDKGLFVS